MTKAAEIRQKYLEFFQNRGHKIIPSAPLVPENDPTTLFTSSGMQPLVPYLLGQPHPEGRRLVNSQKCLRTQDIGEVGDNRHTTFFEMLGNWSLGDYFKKDQLSWFYEFMTKELSLPSDRLYVTVFEGNDSVPKDTESIEIWTKLGIPENRIFQYGAKKNWWSRAGEPDLMPPGEPGGPDSEVFYDFGAEREFHENSPWKNEICHPNCDCGRFLEIGNSVFMQYQKQADGSLKELPQKNVDFGGGLERLTAAVSGDPDIFNIDLFSEAKKEIAEFGDIKSIRIILDHIRAAMFLIDSGVVPSNKEQGYILRRLLRRAAAHSKIINLELNQVLNLLLQNLGENYTGVYPAIASGRPQINSVITEELSKFEKTLEKGIKMIGKTSSFDLFQTYGFPPEIIEELTKRDGLEFDREEFDQDMHRHQELSRTASKGMFKGGLQDQSDTVVKYHTATHLLHQALRDVLGSHVQQKGSNITTDRLRFDFSHQAKLSDGEIEEVEKIVNEKIKADLPVTRTEMPKSLALAEGALAFFPEKYPDVTSVYIIGDYSKELCGGPHVSSTSRIGPIKVTRQESLGSGVRRLYAQLV